MRAFWTWFSLCVVAVGAVVSAANAQVCPAGMDATSDGHCLSAGQQYCGSGMACGDGMMCSNGGRCFYRSGCYPGYTVVGDRCVPPGKFMCPSGVLCDVGETCGPSRSCVGGPQATGPVCGNGNRAKAGHVCAPQTGNAYDPRLNKYCGTAFCNVQDECGNNECLRPFRQVAVPKAGTGRMPSAPTVNPPAVSRPAPPTVNPPTATGPTAPTPPRTSAPNVPAPTAPTVSPPSVPGPTPPTVNAPTLGAPSINAPR